jgi:hypothetical protein
MGPRGEQQEDAGRVGSVSFTGSVCICVKKQHEYLTVKRYVKEMEEERKKEEEKERAARERADRLFAEKEQKIQEREEQAKLAVAERAASKLRRREEYPSLCISLFSSLYISFLYYPTQIPLDILRYERNKEFEAIQKKQEFEQRQAKLLAAFVKRQERRARKKQLQEHPEVQKNYDEHKVSFFFFFCCLFFSILFRLFR